MIHSRYCSGDSDNGGCDCDGIVPVGSTLPYVQQGMVLRAPCLPRGAWTVETIYEDTHDVTLDRAHVEAARRPARAGVAAMSGRLERALDLAERLVAAVERASDALEPTDVLEERRDG